MKKTILPALAMLIVAAVMLSTASYAWFAISSNVTAEGMNVTIKSESEYLLIMPVNSTYDATEANKTQVLADIRGINKFSAEGIAIGSTALYPAAHKTGMTAADIETLSTTNTSSWYTAIAANAGESDMKEGSEKYLDSLNNYVVKYRYIVSMAQGSTPKTGLWIDGIDIGFATTKGLDDTINPVKVIVTCGSNLYEHGKDNSTNVMSTIPTTAFAGEIDENIFYEFDVYVFYDGNHPDVFTDNFIDLVGATISISLTTTNPNS